MDTGFSLWNHDNNHDDYHSPGKTIDEGAIIGGILLPGSISDKVTEAYRKYLFGQATLQDLPPDPPRFVITS